MQIWFFNKYSQVGENTTAKLISAHVPGFPLLCYNSHISFIAMTLHESLRESLKAALKAKDAVTLRTVRSIMTACTNELVATGKTPQDMLDDAGVLTVVKRLAKQRKESILQFEAANRPELAAPEKEELVVLEAYLPTLMTREQIKPIAMAKKEALGITDKSKLGMLVGAVMKELGGQADGGDVKTVVESLF
jgi:uncharacterized protein